MIYYLDTNKLISTINAIKQLALVGQLKKLIRNGGLFLYSIGLWRFGCSKFQKRVDLFGKESFMFLCRTPKTQLASCVDGQGPRSQMSRIICKLLYQIFISVA